MKKREKVWVVREGDGRSIADVLRRAGEAVDAVVEGRVFLGRRRVTSAQQSIRVGDCVRIGPREEAEMEIKILKNADGIVAVDKPAGIPTVPDRSGSSHSLVARTAQLIDRQPGELRVTSRLDREVSGVVMFALDEASERRLADARIAGKYDRHYVAIAWNEHPLPESGVWSGAIGDGPDPLHRAVDGPNAKASVTKYRVAGRAGRGTLLAVDPITGRTHQIRVHASHAGAPLIGDRDYGGPGRLTLESGKILSTSRIALHAARVCVPDFEVEAPIPTELEELWGDLGGDREAWGKALAP